MTKTHWSDNSNSWGTFARQISLSFERYFLVALGGRVRNFYNLLNRVTRAVIRLEKRTQPRYEVDFPVSMQINSVPEFQLLSGAALTVSKTRLEVACDAETVRILREHRKHDYACEVVFPLPGKETDCQLSCEFFGFRRVSQYRYQVVLAFSQPLVYSLDLLATSANDGESAIARDQTIAIRK